MKCCCLMYDSGSECLRRKSSQWLYNAAENQRQQRNTLVQCRYGNRTTLTDVYRDDTDKFCMSTRPAFQQDTDQRRTVSGDGRLLRAQLVASADCIYCRYGSVDACRPTVAADDHLSRRDSDANVSTDSFQHTLTA